MIEVGKEDKCSGCSCLKCKGNSNKEKSCLSKETLAIMNGCMSCYCCMKYPNNYYWYDKNKHCVK